MNRRYFFSLLASIFGIKLVNAKEAYVKPQVTFLTPSTYTYYWLSAKPSCARIWNGYEEITTS